MVDLFDAELAQLLADLQISAGAQQFLVSLGAKGLDDLAVAIEAGYLSPEVLHQHGVAKIPAFKFIRAIQKVGNCWETRAGRSTLFVSAGLEVTDFYFLVPPIWF